MVDNESERKKLIEHLVDNGILAIFHYIPLHEAPYWKGKYKNISLPVTEKVSKTIIRLPMFYQIQDSEIKYIVGVIRHFFK